MSLKPEKFYDKSRLLTRLKAITKVTDDGHWLWLGKRNKLGHGKIKVGGRNGVEHTVSRISAFIYLNLDLNSDTQQALHKKSCPYKNCWNHDCLYIGTHKDNMEDAKSDYCAHNHLYSSGTTGLNKDGSRYCRICVSKRQKQKRALKKQTINQGE